MELTKLHELVLSLPDRGIPAAEIAVAKDGKIIYHQTVGYSDSAKTKPTSPDDIYWIFSATKVITCIAAMRLVERGLLDINDPVSKYIPEFGNMKLLGKGGEIIGATEPMRIVHLFTMSGGLDYDLKAPNILNATDKSTLGLVRAMAQKPLLFEPGTNYRYSLCHDVLAAVVEVISGMSYYEYLKQNIFEPLGIKDMGFHPTDEQRARFSTMYKFRNGIQQSVEMPIRNEYCLSDQYESGGAGLFSTVSEYIKIVSAISCNGRAENGYVLLRPETVQMMKQNRMCDKGLDTCAKFGYGWGLCCRTHMNPLASFSASPIGEMGWDGAAGAYTTIDTDNRLAMFFAMHIRNCAYSYAQLHPRLRNYMYTNLD